jgi:hypothetical protein
MELFKNEKHREFLDRPERFRSATDPEEAKRLGDTPASGAYRRIKRQFALQNASGSGQTATFLSPDRLGLSLRVAGFDPVWRIEIAQEPERKVLSLADQELLAVKISCKCGVNFSDQGVRH